MTTATSSFQPLTSDSVTDTIDVLLYPDLLIVKTSLTSSDPVNGTSNPKAIPGATVLYTIRPGNDNNYMQGFGVGFGLLSEEENAHLKKFIEERFLNEVSTAKAGVGEFCEHQLKS